MKRAMKNPRKQGNEEAEKAGRDLLFWMWNICKQELGQNYSERERKQTNKTTTNKPAEFIFNWDCEHKRKGRPIGPNNKY